MASKRVVGECFALLCANYTEYASKHLGTEQQVKEALTVLTGFAADIADDVLKAAVMHHMATSEWWPKVAQLRAIAHKLTKADEVMSAGDAWALVQRYMSLPASVFYDGKSHKRKPLPPLIERAVRGIGGITALQKSDYPIADRARFFEVYNIMVARETEMAVTLPSVRALAGRYATQLESGANVTAIESGIEGEE